MSNDAQKVADENREKARKIKAKYEAKRKGPRQGGSRVIDEEGNVVSVNGVPVTAAPKPKKPTRSSEGGE